MAASEHQPRPDNSPDPNNPDYMDWGEIVNSVRENSNGGNSNGGNEHGSSWPDYDWSRFDAATNQSDGWGDPDPYSPAPPDIDPGSGADPTPDPDVDPDLSPDQAQPDQGDGIEYFDPDTFEPDQSPEQARRTRVSKIARNILRRVGGSREVTSERALAARRDRAEQDILRPAESMVVDDKEILGNSEFVNLQVQEAQHDITNYRAATEFRDSLATPRNNYVDWRRKRIQQKVERLERKVNASPDTRWNRHRQKTLDMFKNRVKWREGQLAKRSEAKSKRGEALAARIDKRDIKLQKEIDNIVNKKIEAQRRKVERANYKADRGHRFSHFVIHPFERTKYLDSLTPEQKQEITKQAILNVREKNIKKGQLDVSHSVDPNRDTREVNDYELAA